MISYRPADWMLVAVLADHVRQARRRSDARAVGRGGEIAPGEGRGERRPLLAKGGQLFQEAALPCFSPRTLVVRHKSGKALVPQASHEETTRLQDAAARLGGDEFGLLLPEVDTPNAIAAAERSAKARGAGARRRPLGHRSRRGRPSA